MNSRERRRASVFGRPSGIPGTAGIGFAAAYGPVKRVVGVGFGLRRALLAAQPPQLLLQLSVSSLGTLCTSLMRSIIGTRPLIIDARFCLDPGHTLIIEGRDVATGLRVVPLQAAVMPPDVEVSARRCGPAGCPRTDARSRWARTHRPQDARRRGDHRDTRPSRRNASTRVC